MLAGQTLTHAVANLLGVLFPAYRTFKALESPNEEDDTRELKYWTVYAFIVATEIYFEWFLCYLPFYYEIKLALLLWMIFPISFLGPLGGADLIYNLYFKPFLDSREKVIDDMLVDYGLGSLVHHQEEVLVPKVAELQAELQADTQN
ncbi:receptor expression-enhancing protein [Acrasis kona]|uniref:Receptor expression-enhancing protein n=1 Tax=Acrasis kona TaxID=1008807 RepID=A0AAW2YZ83_9EUKA